LAAASADLDERLAELSDRESLLLAEQVRLRLARERTDRILAVREAADKLSAENVTLHAEASQAAANGLSRRDQRATELAGAQGETGNATADLSTSISEEKDAEQALADAREWIVGYVESLLIGEKNATVNKATDYEKHRNDLEVKAMHYLTRQKRSLKSHTAHLALLHEQLNIAGLEYNRDFASTEHKTSEKIVLDARDKLDKMMADDQETGEKIWETYKEIQRLMQVYQDAKKAYDEQDPEERKRSFSTAIER
jgi:hypothetical protein